MAFGAEPRESASLSMVWKLDKGVVPPKSVYVQAVCMNGLSGGQYSLYRVLLGMYLATRCLWIFRVGLAGETAVLDAFFHPLFNGLSFATAPGLVASLLGIGGLAAVALALGTLDRLAAVILIGIWILFFSGAPLNGNPEVPCVVLLLVVHALLPAGPYGAWRARDRNDPGGGWSFPSNLSRLLWAGLVVAYGYNAFVKWSDPSWVDGGAITRHLHGPQDLNPGGSERLLAWLTLGGESVGALLLLWRKSRPWAWFGLFALHLALTVAFGMPGSSGALLLLHVVTFDPNWIPGLSAAKSGQREIVFYDGECGLCHRATRFLLAEDEEARFHLAPLQGETMQAIEKTDWPDSILVQTSAGDWLNRTSALIYIGRRLGGYWRVCATLGWVIPRPMRDAVYNGVARIRKRVFTQPEGLCPMVPPHLGERFLL